METAPPTSLIKRFFGETTKTLLIVSALALLIRSFLVQPFIVEGRSMEVSYHSSDYLLVDKLTYRLREPHRGEVIVFSPPRTTRENYIKRIVGLPGERLTIQNGAVTIYNQTHPEGKVLEEPYLSRQAARDFAQNQSPLDLTLSTDEYFVLGDNRGVSTDSRVFGPVKRGSVIGRSLVRLFPVDSLTLFAYAADPLDAN